MIEIKVDDEIYTEEQYKKDYVRMMDSLRQDRLGEKNCYGVDCADCPLLKETCQNQGEENSDYRCLETVKIVHDWAKAHPIITNEDMLKKTFGDDVLSHICSRVFEWEWFDQEYKEPKGEKENG